MYEMTRMNVFGYSENSEPAHKDECLKRNVKTTHLPPPLVDRPAFVNLQILLGTL
jgi:hypothetical protein